METPLMPFGFYPKGTVILPPLPKWPEGQRQFVTILDLRNAVARHSPQVDIAGPKDAQYLLVPYSLINEACAWTLLALKRQGISYVTNSWDCENFVNELDQTLRKIAALAGITASPLTACISVRLNFMWAGVPAGGYHALAGIMTDRGLIICESQNAQVCPIEQYPNRTTITLVDNV